MEKGKFTYLIIKPEGINNIESLLKKFSENDLKIEFYSFAKINNEDILNYYSAENRDFSNTDEYFDYKDCIVNKQVLNILLFDQSNNVYQKIDKIMKEEQLNNNMIILPHSESESKKNITMLSNIDAFDMLLYVNELNEKRLSNQNLYGIKYSEDVIINDIIKYKNELKRKGE